MRHAAVAFHSCWIDDVNDISIWAAVSADPRGFRGVMKPPVLPQRTARLGYPMAVAPRDGRLLDLRHQRHWVYGFWCRVNHAWLDQHGRKLYGVDKWRPS